MKEELTCSVCSQSWKRQKSRGRKPKICPKCISSGYTTLPSSQPEIVQTNPQSTDKKSIDSDSKITISKVHGILHPKPNNYQQMLESTKNGSVWKCTSCGFIQKINLPITDTPTHRCTPDTVTVKPFERIS